MLKYQFQTINYSLQSGLVCEQRHMLRMIVTHTKILGCPRRVGWEASGNHWNGIAPCK